MKAMLKQLFSLSLASAMAFASVVATAIAPQAALATHRAACGAQTQYGFASHGRASSQGKRIDGIRARFEPLSIELCTGSTSAARSSWMWVAIEGACGTSGNCILQLGMAGLSLSKQWDGGGHGAVARWRPDARHTRPFLQFRSE